MIAQDNLFIFVTERGLPLKDQRTKKKQRQKIQKSKRRQLLNKYTIYSKKNCSYCDRAVALLETKNIPYEIKKIDENIDFYKEMKVLAPHMRTVPVIFKKELLIGGFTELCKYLEQ